MSNANEVVTAADSAPARPVDIKLSEAHQVLGAEYRSAVRATAHQVITQWQQRRLFAENRDVTLRDIVSQRIDSSEWVTNPKRAKQLLLYSDNADAYLEVMGDNGALTEGDGINWSVLAFWAFHEDVLAFIDREMLGGYNEFDFATEAEARAFSKALEYVNDSALSVQYLGQGRDGRWCVVVKDDDVIDTPTIYQYRAPNGRQIVGQVARVDVRLDLIGFAMDGNGDPEPMYASDKRTEGMPLWDSLEPKYADGVDSEKIYVDEEHAEWTLGQCTREAAA